VAAVFKFHPHRPRHKTTTDKLTATILLTTSTPATDNCFIPFQQPVAASYTLPEKFTYPFSYKPHALALLASEELQRHLAQQQVWDHNFGLEDRQEGPVIGKMFGVLVVETLQNKIGYLAAFSGKLAGGFHHPHFVPPVFDSLTEGSFLNSGMTALTRINQEIKLLQALGTVESLMQIDQLQKLRKANSIALQGKLFDAYRFLNQTGEEKNLRELFRHNANSNPPAGAGECAAPKLLQYAFQQKMKPLALAEFWWGQSPKSAYWKHGHFYPACREKCAPILAHMLAGIALEEKPA
jgi:tRNA pseudouridine32 synthase / 23S rRNA pseudouridine746 synthase